jgi:hypothetical protein
MRASRLARVATKPRSTTASNHRGSRSRLEQPISLAQSMRMSMEVERLYCMREIGPIHHACPAAPTSASMGCPASSATATDHQPSRAPAASMTASIRPDSAPPRGSCACRVAPLEPPAMTTVPRTALVAAEDDQAGLGEAEGARRPSGVTATDWGSPHRDRDEGPGRGRVSPLRRLSRPRPSRPRVS